MANETELLKAASDAVQAAEKAQAAAAIVERIKPSRLSRLNNIVTVIAGILTVGIGVVVKSGEARLQKIKIQSERIENEIKKSQEQAARIENRISLLDERAKTEDASYKFAREFLAQVKDNLEKNPRGTQLAVAALNIIAQASSSDSGKSSNELRAELPLHMALLLGDPGSIATLDPELIHLEQWFEFAAADADDQTRVTAVRALCALCRQAVRAGKLDRIDLCTARIELLLPLLSEGEGKETIEQRTIALAAKSKLQAFLNQHDAELQASILPSNDARLPKPLIAAVLKRFETTVSALQDTAFKLRATDQAVTTTQSANASAAVAPSAQVQQTLAVVNEALQAIAQVSGSQVGTLIEQLTSPDDATRLKARSSLALLRQAAVKPMCEELKKRQTKEDDASNKVRLGVATALSRMVQPIVIEADQALLIVELIAVPDPETRQATADFLMNLEGAATVQNVYGALAMVVNPKGGLPKLDANSPAAKQTGNAIKNAAIILATWVRVLTDDNVGPDGITPMNVWARKTVEGLKSDLQKRDYKQWADTIDTITELVQRADRTRKKLAKV